MPGRDFGCLYSVFSICCLLFAAALESEVLLTLLPSCDLQGSGKQGKHVANGHSNISTALLGFRVGVQVQQPCLNPCLCQLLPHVQQDGTCCPPISRWAMRALLFLCLQPAQRTSDIAGLGNSWVGLKFVDRVTTACCGCCSC